MPPEALAIAFGTVFLVLTVLFAGLMLLACLMRKAMPSASADGGSH